MYKSAHNYIALDPYHCDELNGDTWVQKVGVADIIVFPSNVPHSVGKVTSDKTRVSLAFNSFLRGTLGKEAEKTELKL
jgi:quercetin dioxygenase-like cupin family protein